MRQKLLCAAMAAVVVVSLGTGAFASEHWVVGGGGGGGGGAAGTTSDVGGSGGMGGAAGNTVSDDDSWAGIAGKPGNNGGAGGGLGGQSHTPPSGYGGSGNFPEPPTTSRGGGGSAGKTVNINSMNTGLHYIGGTGGNGGNGKGGVADGGDGGDGGGVSVGIGNQSSLVFTAITVQGGNGGNAGVGDGGQAGGGGGDGGDAVFNYSRSELMLDSGITVGVYGGNTGAGDNTGGALANGGNGGDAEFNATNTDIILRNATIEVLYGAKSAAPGSAHGGNAAFTAKSLKAIIGGGEFTTAGVPPNDGTGMGVRTIHIGSIEALHGNMKLDFTTLNRTYGDTAEISGNITVGAGRTLTVDGVDGVNFDWTGNNLVTYAAGGNYASFAGGGTLDASGKSITANVDAAFDVTGGTSLIHGPALKVDANTSVTLNIDAGNASDFADPSARINVFDSVSGMASLDGKSFTVNSGAKTGDAVFAADGKSLAGSLSLTTASGGGGSLAHAMLLAAPAVVSLVNGGGDALAAAAGSFRPEAPLRQGGSGFSSVHAGAFASMRGGHVEVETGSGVESNDFHLLVGPGIRVDHGTGKTDFGAFFEAGWGSYDVYSAVNRGDGDSRYYGGGLLLRHDACSGLYGEASVRAGGARSEYRGINDTDFDMESAYFGGHLGVGYVFRPADAVTVDVFAKGILTHAGSDSATDGAGWNMDVDATTSVRTQLGAKYAYNLGNRAGVYGKAVWEQEYDGETGGRYDGTRIDRADTGGATGIAELGVDWRVGERATVSASVYGMAGQRRGFGGSVNVGFGF